MSAEEQMSVAEQMLVLDISHWNSSKGA